MAATPQQPPALPLRARKKALTRAAILECAERLFEERGFDNVTVAEIADAANVSVKTLFVYFRSKEDLAFADTTLIDTLVAAVRERPAGVTAAAAFGAALHRLIDEDESDLEGYHRLVGDSVALRSRLLRMWSDSEDALTAALAERPAPADRLLAMWLIAVVRSMTTPEVRTSVAAAPDQ